MNKEEQLQNFYNRHTHTGSESIKFLFIIEQSDMDYAGYSDILPIKE